MGNVKRYYHSTPLSDKAVLRKMQSFSAAMVLVIVCIELDQSSGVDAVTNNVRD
jgi:hypothetical protein